MRFLLSSEIVSEIKIVKFDIIVHVGKLHIFDLHTLSIQQN